MPLLTLKAQIHATPEVEAVLKEAMRSATKVYNGLLWHLREAYKGTGKVDLSRKNLNRILKELPRAKDYYSMSVQLTREEVREAYKAFFALRKEGKTNHQAPGFRRKGLQTVTLFVIIHISSEALPLGPQARHGLPHRLAVAQGRHPLLRPQAAL